VVDGLGLDTESLQERPQAGERRLGVPAELAVPDAPELPADAFQVAFALVVVVDRLGVGVVVVAVAFDGEAFVGADDDQVDVFAAGRDLGDCAVAAGGDRQVDALLEEESNAGWGRSGWTGPRSWLS
jgi:hypothetical protein